MLRVTLYNLMLLCDYLLLTVVYYMCSLAASFAYLISLEVPSLVVAALAVLHFLLLFCLFVYLVLTR